MPSAPAVDTYDVIPCTVRMSIAQQRYDPTKPMLQWGTAWRALRDGAGLHGLRFPGLRHTVITSSPVADHVLESISGHLSRRMLEHSPVWTRRRSSRSIHSETLVMRQELAKPWTGVDPSWCGNDSTNKAEDISPGPGLSGGACFAKC